MMISSRHISLLTALCISACFANAQDLVILHTNDTHSQIEEIRAGKGAGLGGVHRRAAYFDSVRSSCPNVLLLDAGDYNQGTPYFNVFHGNLEIELMNALGYEVVGLGNHEFDNGQEELARRLSMARFRTVCANYDFTGTPLDGLIEPYVIIDKGGWKIGIFGLTLDLREIVAKDNLRGLVYRDAAAVALDISEKLKTEERCDLVIALTHLGYDVQDDDDNPVSDVFLASISEYIDIIIGGHSHTFLSKAMEFPNARGKDVPVVQTGEKGEWVGRFDIFFDGN